MERPEFVTDEHLKYLDKLGEGCDFPAIMLQDEFNLTWVESLRAVVYHRQQRGNHEGEKS